MIIKKINYKYKKKLNYKNPANKLINNLIIQNKSRNNARIINNSFKQIKFMIIFF